MAKKQKKQKSQPWHNLSPEKIISSLGTDTKRGLSEKEVKARQKKFGLNKIPEEKPLSALRLFLEQFRSPLIYILVIAGIVTLSLEHYTDSIVIFVAVALNTVVGYFQEAKASKALRELKKILKVKAVVIREGDEKEVFQEELVLGDIVILKSGDKVPADGRLIETENLKVNEMALTGEWLPADKKTDILAGDTPMPDRDNMVYTGTVVEDGRGMAVVTGIGLSTEIGKVAQMIKETKEEKTPYQKKLAYFSKIISIVIAVICVGIFIEGMLTGGEFVEMFTTAVAVAVAAIPEGLPISMTVILALGMQHILKRKGLVRKLVSAETLGSTSVICTDKTATLTEGKMRVAGIYTATKDILSDGKKYLKKTDKDGKESYTLALKIATSCSEAFIENPEESIEKWVVRGRPTDRALLLAGTQAGLSKKELEKGQPKISEIPFDPVYKFSANLREYSKGENILYVLGAPELILKKSKYIELDGRQAKVSKQRLSGLKRKYEDLTSKGLRVLGTAYKKVKKVKRRRKGGEKELTEKDVEELIFVGFIALSDPLRPEVKKAIRTTKQAGIRPIIVTGDHRLTARAIAEELGLPAREENILEGRQLDKMSEKEFGKRFKDITVYARVEPRHKLRIVGAWQKRGEVVAMTGDGINDAPALKKADVGVALGSGTDVAKEVSDLVLLTDNFSVIVAAVEEGRAIIDNIRKVITYLLSDSFSEVILVGASLLAGLPLPILPAQILWTNLVEDGLPDIALAFEPKEEDVMKQKPQGHDIPLLTGEMKVLIFITGIIDDIFLFGLFLWLLWQGLDIFHIRTIIFAGLTIDTFYVAFCCKSLKKNLWHMDLLSNKFLVGTVLLGVLMLLSAVYVPVFQTLLRTVPLGVYDWLILLGLAAIEIVLIETTKWHFIVKEVRQNKANKRK